MAPLVPAKRLPGREIPVADVALVRSPAAPGRARGLPGRRRRRRHGHRPDEVQPGRGPPMAGLVAAESLVGGEGLAAYSALEGGLGWAGGGRGRGRGGPSVAVAGEHYEAEGEELVLCGDNLGTHREIVEINERRRCLIL